MKLQPYPHFSPQAHVLRYLHGNGNFVAFKENMERTGGNESYNAGKAGYAIRTWMVRMRDVAEITITPVRGDPAARGDQRPRLQGCRLLHQLAGP